VANIKSQKKRVITNEKRHQRNRAVKSALKTAVKKVHVAIEAGDAAAAKAAALEASTLLDKAAGKGIIHAKQAANRKSGMMKAANKVS
jgi:small subunit ribosomal protein S20